MIQGRFLTVSVLIGGYVFNKIESLFSRREVGVCPETIGKYSLVKVLTRASSSNPTTTGKYIDAESINRVVRVLPYRYRNMTYWTMVHEASVMEATRHLSKQSLSGRKIRFQHPVSFFEFGKQLVFVKEFTEGEVLGSLPLSSQAVILRECRDFLESLTEISYPKELSLIPKRSNIHLLLTFFPHLINAFLKKNLQLKEVVVLGRFFLHTLLSLPLFRTQYVLTHRDLHPKNIIINDAEIVIIDMATCLLSQKGTDLAKGVWSCSAEASISLLKESLYRETRKDEQRKLIALLVYYGVQRLSIMSRDSEYYPSTRKCLRMFFEDIVPSLDKNNNAC